MSTAAAVATGSTVSSVACAVTMEAAVTAWTSGALRTAGSTGTPCAAIGGFQCGSAEEYAVGFEEGCCDRRAAGTSTVTTGAGAAAGTTATAAATAVFGRQAIFLTSAAATAAAAAVAYGSGGAVATFIAEPVEAAKRADVLAVGGVVPVGTCISGSAGFSVAFVDAFFTAATAATCGLTGRAVLAFLIPFLPSVSTGTTGVACSCTSFATAQAAGAGSAISSVSSRTVRAVIAFTARGQVRRSILLRAPVAVLTFGAFSGGQCGADDLERIAVHAVERVARRPIFTDGGRSMGAFYRKVLQAGRGFDVFTDESNAVSVAGGMSAFDRHFVIGATCPFKHAIGGVFGCSVIAAVEAYAVFKLEVFGIGSLRNVDFVSVTGCGDFEGAGDGLNGGLKGPVLAVVACCVVDKDAFRDVSVDAIAVGVGIAPIVIRAGYITWTIDGTCRGFSGQTDRRTWRTVVVADASVAVDPTILTTVDVAGTLIANIVCIWHVARVVARTAMLDGVDGDLASIVGIVVTVVKPVHAGVDAALMGVVFDLTGGHLDVGQRATVIRAATAGFGGTGVDRALIHHGAGEPSVIAIR